MKVDFLFNLAYEELLSMVGMQRYGDIHRVTARDETLPTLRRVLFRHVPVVCRLVEEVFIAVRAFVDLLASTRKQISG